ncbi:hypothetical protein C8039_04235 [Halogeometricum sp. wsp3]|nr:hypothetical protein C8039_04235 [Halogeometricum sp. wsp3]
MNGAEMAGQTAWLRHGRQLDAQSPPTCRNDRIPPWWVTHIDNGETSTVGITPRHVLDVGERQCPSGLERTIETDLLASSTPPRRGQ